MVPKIIHYCWFGGKPIPKKYMKYIKSWKKFFPDYEIKCWNESNFDINCCDYVKEAYQAKKYAFVSDFARFKILYEEGGIYFDTDVEVIKPFDDILSKGGFMGCETESTINPGLGLAVAPGLPLYKELVEDYYRRHFKNEDGTLNLKTIVEYTTETLKKYGLEDASGIQEVAGVFVYPKDFFNPIDFDTGKIKKTKNTHSVHHYAASWETRRNVFRGKIYHFLVRFFGKKIADKIRSKVGRKK